ncbi:MAG: hypothetical protein LUD01_10590 [Clostridiales bacterium]|nr:hypothetical protein [Clostridiales bacterium]
MRKKLLAGTIIAAAACLLLGVAGFRVYRAGSFSWDIFTEEENVPAETSTAYQYDLAFSRTLFQYSSFRTMYRADYSTAIPGLENTCFSESESRQMVPQGICIAEEYMLITAYDKTEQENSVIYVLSNEDASKREFLTLIVLPDCNHVGGIAYDGSNLWVAKSTSKCLGRISSARIEEAVESGQSVYELDDYDEEVSCGMTASFVSWNDDRLWVGTSHSLFSQQGKLAVFLMDSGEEGTELTRQFTLDIPDYVQGLSFFSVDETPYVVMSASFGRFSDSCLYLYREEISDKKLKLYYETSYELPPMVEELISDGEFTYCLFESAATCYSAADGFSCHYPVDRVCALQNRMLAGADEAADDF